MACQPVEELTKDTKIGPAVRSGVTDPGDAMVTVQADGIQLLPDASETAWGLVAVLVLVLLALAIVGVLVLGRRAARRRARLGERVERLEAASNTPDRGERVDAFSSRALAEVACSALRSRGMNAWVVADDAGGAGGLSLSLDHGGAEVRVPTDQWRTAREILDLPTA